MPDSASSSAMTLRQDAPEVQQVPPKASLPVPAPLEERAPVRTKGARGLPTASFEVRENKTTAAINFAHPDREDAVAIYSAALKTSTEDELYGILTQIAAFAQKADSSISETKFNDIVQTVANMRPRDITETMLCVQMVAIHHTTMQFAGRLSHQTNIRVSEAYERSLNKLARTYTTQMTTLKHYRSSGKQRIDVRHVTVNEGGQAIVGDVTHGRRGEDGDRSENHEATA